MPNTSAGIQAPPSAELLAEVASTMPSIWPVPNFSGSFENRLRHRVGNPGGDVGAGAGQRADQHADGRAAEEIAPSSASRHGPDAAEDIADLLRQDRAGLVDRDDAAQHLGDREHADHGRNEADALHQLDAAEGEARMPGGRIDPDAADRKSDQQRREALQRRVGRDEDRAGEAEQASQKYSNDEKLIANSASAGARRSGSRRRPGRRSPRTRD